MTHFKKIFLITGLFVFALLSIMTFSGGKSLAQENSLSVDTTAVDSSETGEQILALLQELNIIKLDDSILSDPMFLSLKDYHVDLTEEPKQRNNPFAPIGKDIIIEETEGTPINVSTKPKTITSTPTTTPANLP